MPAELVAQESVEAPEPPRILAGERWHDRLVEFVVVVKLIVPLNPLIGTASMVEVPAFSTPVMTSVGLALTPKSLIWYAAVAECDSPPLVPVTVAR